jgi:hypothetical protein
MAHGPKVINLIRHYFLNNPNDIGRIGQVAVVQDKFSFLFMGILV